MRVFPFAIALLVPVAALVSAATQPLTAQEPDRPSRDSTLEQAGDEAPPKGLPSDAAARADDGDTEGEVTYDPTIPWQLSYLPYIRGFENSGIGLAGRVRYWQPAAYEARVVSQVALTADAGINAHGSRFIVGELRAPLLRDGWRFNALVGAQREARFGFYGLGNDTEVDEDLATDAQRFLYRVQRTRYRAEAEVTRRISGPLQVAFLGDVTVARFGALPGPSVFQSTIGERLNQTDVSGRLALVYDTRDNEYNTHQGLLLEAGGQVGSGGDGYERLYGIARGYLQVREGTVVAARVGASGLSGIPPLNARLTVPAWEDRLGALGEPETHRGLDNGRFVGTGLLFGNLEVRYDLLNLGDLGALTLLGFVDAGRVFEGEDFRFTLDDLAVSGGGGLGIRLLRSTIFTFNFAGGAGGFNFAIGSGWMF